MKDTRCLDYGSVCLALDSVLRDLRFVNKQTLLLPHYVDFEEKMPDLNIFAVALDNVKKSLDRLENSLLAKDHGDLNDLISHQIRNELEFMLMNYVESGKNDAEPDFDYMYIKTCVYMVKNLKQMKMRHYGDHLNAFKGDHVKTFLHVVDINVSMKSLCWDYMMQKVKNMRRLCEKIDARLAEFQKDDDETPV
ncbi:ORF120 [Spodoptera eridania nucleopolyhedrovirus]|uniref:ORF120 n=1 Tax=Spodoptera eridania nucleopolyhedrovirus TaxID=2315721 RepID=A0A346TQ55_9ABAC|nr:ORF120 [Spodoptera eridania nucleopolyhedrovirus]AXU41715.1 ORF120 [Spodoptera eridania nucleopolyhedrovirus]